LNLLSVPIGDGETSSPSRKGKIQFLKAQSHGVGRSFLQGGEWKRREDVSKKGGETIIQAGAFKLAKSLRGDLVWV